MKSPSNWPYFKNVNADLRHRNSLLTTFLREGHRFYVLGVLQLHKYMLTTADVYGYSKYFQQKHCNYIHFFNYFFQTYSFHSILFIKKKIVGGSTNYLYILRVVLTYFFH